MDTARLQLLAIALRECVRVASQPGTTAKIYRPARESAVRIAHQLFREWQAVNWREDMRKSLTPPRPWTFDELQADYDRPNGKSRGNWTGD